MWRLGANKNSMITISEEIYFKQDTLPKGTYALFAKPSEDKWELVFYSEYSNWGTPENWEESKALAWDMLNTDQYRGLAEGATHYHATYVNPSWSRHTDMTEVGRIGAHVFYRWDA